LNQFHKEFKDRGLVVIGVTDEPEAKAKPYIDRNKMQYPVAFGGGANEYKTRGIPHSWLVGPGGKIVWKGHPGGLNASIIEKHIEGARMGPKITLPPQLVKSEKYLKAGQFGKAYNDLEKQAGRAKDPVVELAARDAMKKIAEFASVDFARVAQFKKEQKYSAGLQALQRGAVSFKGMAIAKEFEKELKAWKKDKSIQAEMAGSKLLDDAKDLVKRGKYQKAAQIYATLAKSKKYAGSAAQKEAEIRLQEIKKYL